MIDVLYVVETEDDIFVGCLEFINGAVIVRSGFQGHPKTVKAEDIVQLMPAHMHSDVESKAYTKAV